MAHTPTVLAFAGSARKASFNKRLLRVAVKAAESAGAEVTVVDFADLTMPLYDGDLESDRGIPAPARQFKQMMIEHDGFLIASPEYNSSVTPLLKNAIDWASRPEPNEAPLIAFKGKFAGLIAASPGRLGGLRALYDLSRILQSIGVQVLPDMVATPGAADAFDEKGDLKDPKQRDLVRGVGTRLVETIRRMQG